MSFKCNWFFSVTALILAAALLSSTASAQIPVQIINNGPGPETALVDVYVDGNRVADDLAFKEATAFIDGLGNPQIFVGPTSTIAFADWTSTDDSSPLVSYTLTLGELTGPGMIQLIGLVNPIANPDGRSTALQVLVFNGYEPAAPAPNLVRLMAVHASPDAGTVDLLAHRPSSALPAIPIFTGLAYGDMQPYITLLPDSVQLYVVETGTNNIIQSYSASFGLVTGAGVIGNAMDLVSNLTLLGVVASENPLTPGRAITFELNTIPATDVDDTVPRSRFTLGQNYPNPFNPRTVIPLSLGAPQLVRLTVFDSKGRLVRVLLEGEVAAGEHHVPFSGEGLASGTYYYELRIGEKTHQKSMTLLK